MKINLQKVKKSLIGLGVATLIGSAIYFSSMSNTDKYANFVLTQETTHPVAGNSYSESIVKKEFGENYRVADTCDIEEFVKNGQYFDSLFSKFDRQLNARSPEEEVNSGMYITNSNEPLASEDRGYFAIHHGKSRDNETLSPEHFLGHEIYVDNIGGIVSVGSWNHELPVLGIEYGVNRKCDAVNSIFNPANIEDSVRLYDFIHGQI